MATWGDLVEVVNRTSKPLSVRFDGQDVTLEPNYDAAGKPIAGVRNFIPRTVVRFAKDQNVLMGSEDPIDIFDYEPLVGVKAAKGAKQRDDLSFQEQSDAPSRVDLGLLLDDPKLKVVPGRGKHRVSEASVAIPGAGLMAQEPL
jgi:hypothetical protein